MTDHLHHDKAEACDIQGGCSCCEHEHEHEHEEGSLLPFVVRLGAAALLTVLVVALPLSFPIKLALYIAAYLTAGYEVLESAFKNLKHGRLFDENFLMIVATAGAFAIGDYTEAVAVMLFFGIGELLQNLAVTRSRKSIRALMDLRPESASLKTKDGIVPVAPEDVHVGDTIVVRPGERIPLDGTVSVGNSFIDTSAMTGESVPKETFPGEEVLSGGINGSGTIEILVSRPAAESAVARILELAEKAASKKSQTEKFISVFARYYTPAVVFAAAATALIPPFLLGMGTFDIWLYRALTFLIVSCPCALVVSIPVTYFAGIGGASRRGILVKGGNSLEALYKVKTFVFDKTGTLTKGVFNVSKIIPTEGFTKEQVLYLAAVAEDGSNHPVARSISAAYGSAVEYAAAENRMEYVGLGVSADTPDGKIIAGNARLMEQNQVSFAACDKPGTVIYVARDSVFVGAIVVSDEIRPSSKEAIAELHRLGITKTAMLTGDGERVAASVAGELGIDEFYAGLLPDGKVDALEKLMGNGRVAFVGDGINDAPVLARADVGIAMGGLGSDAAVEAADIVLMHDDPAKLGLALRIARKTRLLVVENIVFSLGVKFIVLLLAVFGIATMWSAVFADTGVALLAVLNALRGMKSKNPTIQ